MKIIVANYRYFIAGGPERYMFKFIEAAEKRGIEVIPFSVQNSQNKPTKYDKYFAKPRAKELMYADTKRSFHNYYGIFRATLWNYEAAGKLRRLIKDTKPDAIYILHEINHLSPSIIRAARKENIRIVHRISDFFMFCARYDFLYENEICEACIHGDYTEAVKKKCVKNSGVGTRLRVAAMKLYKRSRVFEDVDKFIATCLFSKNKLIEGGIPADKIECIPTFINAEDVTPCYENEKYFLFLGRMAHQKGTIYAIEAMSHLKDTEYSLKITGEITDAEEDRKIWEYVVVNGLQDKIIFTGFKHGVELDELINKAVCIVCPAIWYENMPNTVIEAYAHGKPVVASRIGSLAEIVVDNETGLLFEIRNSKELADKLRQFVNDPELSCRLGQNARKKCEEDYSEEKHMDRVLAELRGI